MSDKINISISPMAAIYIGQLLVGIDQEELPPAGQEHIIEFVTALQDTITEDNIQDAEADFAVNKLLGKNGEQEF